MSARSIGQAFWFVLANFITLLRLTWLPLAALIAAQVAIGQWLARAAGGASEAALAASPSAEPAFWLSTALQVIALSVVAVRVHRLALFDDRRPGEYFAFPFGRTEALYVTMVVVLIAAVAAIGLALQFSIDTVQARGVPLPERGASRDGDWTALLPVLIYMPISIGFVWFFLWFANRVALWPPALVATDRFALGKAWAMTRGYAMSLFWLVLAASQIILFAVSVRAFAADPHNARELYSQLLDRRTALGGAWLDPISAWIAPGAHSYAVMPSAQQLALDFGLAFFVIAYMAAMFSFAYLSLTEEDTRFSFKPETEAT